MCRCCSPCWSSSSSIASRAAPTLSLPPGELCPRNGLYIVHRGLALYGGRVLGQGRVWGEDTCIIRDESLLLPFLARALNFLECFVITRDIFEDAVQAFPSIQKHLRKCTVTLALRRGVVQAAAKLKAEDPEAGAERHKGSALLASLGSVSIEEGFVGRASSGVNDIQLSLAVAGSVRNPGGPSGATVDAAVSSEIIQALQQIGARQESFGRALEEQASELKLLRERLESSQLLPPTRASGK